MALDLHDKIDLVESDLGKRFSIIEVAGADWHLCQIDDNTRIVASVDDPTKYYHQSLRYGRWHSSPVTGNLQEKYPDFFRYISSVAKPSRLLDTNLISRFPIIKVAAADWHLYQIDDTTRILASVDDPTRYYHQTLSDGIWRSTLGITGDLKAKYPDFFDTLGANISVITASTQGRTANQVEGIE